MYHPSRPCAPKLVLWEGLRCIITLVPGGAIGVAEKLKLPKMAACADSVGLRREDLTRFNVIIAWGSSRSHSAMGYLGSHVHKPAIK